MFSNQSNSKDKTAPKDKDRKPTRDASNTPSIVSSDVKITGDFHSPGEVQFDGVIEGDVACGSLTVGEHAQITGAVTADRAMVHGTIKGSIRARVVHLHSTARLEGDVVHEDLTVDSGAFIDGRCLHVQNPLETEQEKTGTQSSKKSEKKDTKSPEKNANGQEKSAEYGEAQLTA